MCFFSVNNAHPIGIFQTGRRVQTMICQETRRRLQVPDRIVSKIGIFEVLLKYKVKNQSCI